MKTCFSILLLCLQTSLFAQTTWFVHAGATGANTGLSWTDAFPDLHLALDLAQPGDAVWVAHGLYRTDTAANRERHFDLPSGVRLLGGFDGTETDENQRDWIANPTMLSGNIGDLNDSLDNAYNILYMSYPDSTTLLDGFILEHAYADKIGGSNQQPGRSGAAVFVYAIQGSAAPVFQRCWFRYNIATTNGGAVYVNGTTGVSNTPLLGECRFTGNQTLAGNGGAFYWTGGGAYDRGVEFTNCVFENNVSALHGAALFISRNRGTNETVNLTDCLFFNNVAASWGGVCLYDAADSSFQHRLEMERCTFEGNYSGSGAAIVNFFNFVPFSLFFSLENSTVKHGANNPLYDSNGYAGLFACEYVVGNQDSLIFRHNTFSENNIVRMFSTYLTNGVLVLENNTFSHNKGSVQNNRCRLVGFSGKKVHITNNLFYANEGFINYQCESSDFRGNILAGNRFVPQMSNPFSNTPLLTIRAQHNDSINLSNNLFVNNVDQATANPVPVNPGRMNIYNNIFYNNKHAVTGQNTIPIWRDTTFAISNIIDFDNCIAIPNLYCFPSNLSMPNLMLRDTAGGDYRLLPCSSGIHAGNNDAASGLLTDILDNPRISGPAVDIGPYEDPLTGLVAEYIPEPSCANISTGSLTFIVGNNGCMPYEVSWNNEGPIAGLTASPLPAGPVSVALTDAIGKTLVVNVTIPQKPSPDLVSFVSHASSATTADGTLVVEPPAGSGPFQYLWNTGDTTTLLNGLLPGVYTLTLTDAGGCQFTYAYEVSFNIGTTENTVELPVMWPNPASARVQLRWGGCDALDVYSMQGKRLLTHADTAGDQLDVRGLPTGPYQVVYWKNGQVVHRSRLVVVR